ncbi:MAG: glycosyl hydrolase 115 family protein [Bacteroidaceae bacterium]|nr:glycosyl hydrolase 115 family protein [Bacteroidaceae bacterium]
MRKRLFIGLLFAFFCALTGSAKLADRENFTLQRGKNIFLVVEKNEEKVVHLAIDLLKRDVKSVLDAELTTSKLQDAHVIIGTIGQSSLLKNYTKELSSIKGHHEAFLLKVLEDGRLLVAGSDKRGTAYGVLELSRLLGVSPWEWWADATPEKREVFHLPIGYTLTQEPTVPYRGIFLNDEDWGLLPWSNGRPQPNLPQGEGVNTPTVNNKGGKSVRPIGPETYRRIFELMLRLRANTLWPAMHECTLPFFLTEGNREAAADYSIFIGSSHCEPMVCNAAGEWERRGKGAYDYVNNSKEVYKFWEERVKEVAGQDNIYTLGMRGVHDGKMQGAKTVAEQKAVLERVLKDQRDMLAKYVNKDVTQVPQAFIPYKEVLDIYHAGLEVPEEVTLIWCDDNYGYIRHFPTAEERARKGGNGIYYHISYWGRPHDYLWLNTLSPAVAYQQMNEAYDRGIQKMWIINVGDIKPGEYLLELLMDMAWDLDGVRRIGWQEHERRFLTREFGRSIGDELDKVMKSYYRLNYERRPEFLGNTRTEEKDPAWKVVKDLPWSEDDILNRLDTWKELSDKVDRLSRLMLREKQDAYFHLVKYRVQGATQMNEKLLKAQLARHGKADWAESDAAYDSIVALTRVYNEGINNQGKWRGMMDHRPRKLPVFDKVKRNTVDTPMHDNDDLVQYGWHPMYCVSGNPIPCEGLGYLGTAALIPQGVSVTYESEVVAEGISDSVNIVLAFVPRHPVNDKSLRVALSIDNGEPYVVDYATKGRSEEWKVNILWNRAHRIVRVPVDSQKSRHTFTLTALDEGIILDTIYIIDDKYKPYW